MRQFIDALGALLRESDTRALETVIGIMSVILSIHLAMVSFVGATEAVIWSRAGLMPFIPLICVGLMAGGVMKVHGAVACEEQVRIGAAGLLALVWVTLAASILITSWESPLVVMFPVFATQSMWIYIRLSVLRWQRHERGL